MRPLLRAGLLGGLATTAGIALTATSGWLIVRAAEQPVILTLLTAIVAVRTFGIVRPVFRYWERLASHDAALATLAQRRAETYEALLPLTPARLGRRRRSDVLTGVVDDLTDVVDAQVRVTVPVLSAAVAGVVTIALTWWIEPAVAVVLAALALVVTATCRVALRLESRSLASLLDARAEVNRVSELVTAQAHELRAVGGWGTAMDWLAAAQRTLVGATRRQSLGRAATSGLFLLAVAAAVTVTAHVVTPLPIAGPVKALLLLTPVAVADAINPLTDAMQALARARGSADRLQTLLALEPAVLDQVPTGTPRPASTVEPSTPRSGGPHVTARQVAASWSGHRHGDGVGPLDLDLPPGSRTALVGANGSGKSTLLATLARHLDPSAGALEWDGTDVRSRPLDDVRAEIAFVDDEPHVFATTLRNNLLLAAPDASDDELCRALDRAGLGAFATALPEGLDTTMGAGGRGLSGGERARLGIARALASARPVLLLDEPVAHLDRATADAVLADLLQTDRPERAERADLERGPSDDEAARPTVVMATHRPEGLEHFDRVIALDAQPGTATGSQPPQRSSQPE